MFLLSIECREGNRLAAVGNRTGEVCFCRLSRDVNHVVIYVGTEARHLCSFIYQVLQFACLLKFRHLRSQGVYNIIFALTVSNRDDGNAATNTTVVELNGLCLVILLHVGHTEALRAKRQFDDVIAFDRFNSAGNRCVGSGDITVLHALHFIDSFRFADNIINRIGAAVVALLVGDDEFCRTGQRCLNEVNQLSLVLLVAHHVRFYGSEWYVKRVLRHVNVLRFTVDGQALKERNVGFLQRESNGIFSSGAVLCLNENSYHTVRTAEIGRHGLVLQLRNGIDVRHNFSVSRQSHRVLMHSRVEGEVRIAGNNDIR